MESLVCVAHASIDPPPPTLESLDADLLVPLVAYVDTRWRYCGGWQQPLGLGAVHTAARG